MVVSANVAVSLGNEMLTFDHKVKTHYKDKVRGVALVYEVIRTYQELGYPNEQYRVLCWDCNTSIGFYGYCPHKKEKEWNINKGRKLKSDMIEAYGGKCVLCGETRSEFLMIDHINGGGNEHRKSIGGAGSNIYVWLKKQGWPRNGFRLLCANCNCSVKTEEG